MARAVLPPVSHEHITAVIDRVLGSFMSDGRLHPHEADDVRSTVMLRVLRQLEDGRDGDDVHNANDYVARMTINAANDVLRARRLAPVELDETDAGPSIEPPDTFATRQMLVLLWDAIGQLPLMQRRALLLHARDHNGGSAIPLLVFTGVATLDEIAAILGYDRATMETLWDGVPMADLEIARLLGSTRPQVISLRRAARERLERARQRLLSPRSK